MKGEDLDEDSFLGDIFGAITWAKVAMVTVILVAIVICCGMGMQHPEFWE